MAKPAYSLIYAILIGAGLLALVLFNRLLSSEDAAPAAQASLHRNEATAREAREAAADGAEKQAQDERTEAAGTAAAKSDAQAATPAMTQADAAPEAAKEEERK